MPIPTHGSLHWRSIYIGIFLRADDLVTASLKGLLEPDTPLELAGDEFCETRVFLWSPDADEEEEEASYLIDMRSVRQSEVSSTTGMTVAEFWAAFTNAIPGLAIVPVLARVSLRFEAPFVWRLPLLTDPPDLGEVTETLGRLTLDGITMSFDDSPVGLLNAALSTLGDGNDQAVDLTFRMPIEKGSLEDVHERTLRHAETLAEVFVKKPPQAKSSDG